MAKTTEQTQEAAPAPAAPKEVKTFYFKSPVFAGLTVQVQKMVKNPDGSERQEVDHQETFTQYFDTFKGDVIRVGYLATQSEKIAALCEADLNVVTITKKEYDEAVESLQLAPAPAV